MHLTGDGFEIFRARNGAPRARTSRGLDKRRGLERQAARLTRHEADELLSTAADALGAPLLRYYAAVALSRGELAQWARVLGHYARRGEYAMPRETRVFALVARRIARACCAQE